MIFKGFPSNGRALFLVTVTLYDSRTIWSRGTEKNVP